MECEKPELSQEDWEVVALFGRLHRQQQVSAMSGHLLGLRFEAVAEAIRWYAEAGVIIDPDYVMDRIWILDEVFCKIHNEKVDAASKK